MKKVEVKMLCKLYVTFVILQNLLVTLTRAQSPLISKYINMTTITGETIDIDCSENKELPESLISFFKWYKTDKLLNKKNNSNKMLLVGSYKNLRIVHITDKEEGIYECHILNEFMNVYSMYSLTVTDLPKPTTYHKLTSNQVVYVGGHLNIFCDTIYYEHEDSYFEQFKFFKDGIPLSVGKNNENVSRFRWSRTSLDIYNITYADGGTYQCFASNKFRIEFTGINYKVISEGVPYPMYLNSNNNTFIRGDGRFHMNCLFSFIDNPTHFNYTWSKNDKPLGLFEMDSDIALTRKNYTLSINTDSFRVAGNYKCSASNKSHTFISNRTVNIVDLPEKLDHRWYSLNISVMTEVTLQLKCFLLPSTENYKTTYTWKKNGKPLIVNEYTVNMDYDTNERILKFYNITSNDSGTYECEAENYYQKVYSAYILKVVDPELPKIYNSSQSTTSVNVGESLQLFCRVRGIPTPVITWLKNGLLFDLPENNDRVFFQEYKQVLIFNISISEDSGSYQCKVLNTFGNDTSNYNIRINDKNDITDEIYLGFGILIFGGVLVMCGVYFIKSLRVEKNLEANKLKFFNGDLEKWNVNLDIPEQIDLLPYDKKWEFPKNKLKLGEHLGSGAFGVVFKADAIGINNKTTSTTVAVKMVKINSDVCHIQALISELKIMIHIGKHLNIVNVLGACTQDINNGLMVIVEYCRYGSARECLLNQRERFINQFSSESSLTDENRTLLKPNGQNALHKIYSYDCPENPNTFTKSKGDQINDIYEPPWCYYEGVYVNENTLPLCTQDLLDWSYQISRGMEYLASKRVIHGDLALRNILLADDKVIKISDFGLAKTMHNYDFYKMSKNVPLPVKWMAIESIRDQVFSTKSDVWSFGIVLWEIFSLAETPYPDIISFSELYGRLVSGYRMKKPEYANHEIYNIMYDCWNINPKSRPSFVDLIERISDLLQECSKTYYIKLNEDFIKKNNNTSPSTHYANILSSSNRLTMSDENPILHLRDGKILECNDGVEMKLMVHNQSYL